MSFWSVPYSSGPMKRPAKASIYALASGATRRREAIFEQCGMRRMLRDERLEGRGCQSASGVEVRPQVGHDSRTDERHEPALDERREIVERDPARQQAFESIRQPIDERAVEAEATVQEMG